MADKIEIKDTQIFSIILSQKNGTSSSRELRLQNKALRANSSRKPERWRRVKPAWNQLWYLWRKYWGKCWSQVHSQTASVERCTTLDRLLNLSEFYPWLAAPSTVILLHFLLGYFDFCWRTKLSLLRLWSSSILLSKEHSLRIISVSGKHYKRRWIQSTDLKWAGELSGCSWRPPLLDFYSPVYFVLSFC